MFLPSAAISSNNNLPESVTEAENGHVIGMAVLCTVGSVLMVVLLTDIPRFVANLHWTHKTATVKLNMSSTKSIRNLSVRKTLA